MRVHQLRAALEGVHDNAEVVFQANVFGEEDNDTNPSHTTVIGTVFSVFVRSNAVIHRPGSMQTEFVIDGAVTDSEL